METGKKVEQADAIILQISSTCQESKNSQVSSSSNLELTEFNSISRKSPPGYEISKPCDITKSPFLASPAVDGDDWHEIVHPKVSKELGMKWKGKLICIELITFVCIIGFLISTLTIDRLHSIRIWGLQIWNWCVLILAIFCGRLLAECFICTLVFLIEKKILLQKGMLYYVYVLKKSVVAFVWLSLILLVWGLSFSRGVKRSGHTTKILNYVTRTLGACLVGVAIWILKTFLVKLLAATFYICKFFDRIQESISHHYVLAAILGPRVLTTLSGPPLSTQRMNRTPTKFRLSSLINQNLQNEEAIEEFIDVEKLKIMNHEMVSAWTMHRLINVISDTRLTVVSEIDDKQVEQEINSEQEAKATANRIFSNVAGDGTKKFICKSDLLRFMEKKEADLVFSLIVDAAETGMIKRSTFRDSVVNVYKDREFLVKSLKGTKAAIENLNKLACIVTLVIILIVWLLVMGLLTFEVLIVILSQIALVSFMFGNAAKSIFEAVIFVFVTHPFDVGNQCIIDNEQMVVDEIHMLTTIFIKQDGKKIHYPNSVLITKAITNSQGSIETQDSVEFDISGSTLAVEAMKEKVKRYLEMNSKFWHPEHTIEIKKIEDEHKMSMVLHINHKIDIHSRGDKTKRRNKLVKELKMIFDI